jgi:hypothetical protein
MIKPLEEYSPEDRAFVEYVKPLRSEYPRPGVSLAGALRTRDGMHAHHFPLA